MIIVIVIIITIIVIIIIVHYSIYNNYDNSSWKYQHREKQDSISGLSFPTRMP